MTWHPPTCSSPAQRTASPSVSIQARNQQSSLCPSSRSFLTPNQWPNSGKSNLPNKSQITPPSHHHYPSPCQPLSSHKFPRLQICTLPKPSSTQHTNSLLITQSLTFPPCLNPFVLVFYCCSNKLSQSQQPETTQIYYLRALKARIPAIVWLGRVLCIRCHKAKTRGWAGLHSFLETLEMNILPSSFRL